MSGVEAGQGQSLLGAGHGHIIESSCRIPIFMGIDPVPVAVEYDDVIELQAFGPMRGEKQQTGLPASCFPPPFGQPIQKMFDRPFRITCFEFEAVLFYGFL